MEAPCGAVVYAKSPHDKLPPASITKIVTALTAIDRVKLNDRVIADVSAKDLAAKTHSSVMGLEPGMVLTVEDLFYGLFLPSGNDAAIQLAEQVSGNVDDFVKLMNQEAASLGMNDSHFENPHGLDANGHVSSTYDMDLAGMALEQNPELAKIAATASYTLPGGLRLDNGNKLLTKYPGTFGVKIGSTDAAKHTIVAAVTRNNRTLYLSLFGSDDLYDDSIRLLDWAFSSTAPAC
jgi:D-alanyl-D-alanine carboxypeptidase (penicillin-binding protein 5/6)